MSCFRSNARSGTHLSSVRAFLLGALCFVSSSAFAAEPQGESGTSLSREEIEAWLESRSLPTDIANEAPPEAPPPAPRDYGFVVESSVGALGHLGALKTVSPTSPWFHLQLGWEPVRWAMLIAETDIAFGNTSYANPPPEPRGYVLYGFGGGVRFTLEPTDWLGIFVEGDIGVTQVSSDILATYGFADADDLNPYFGGLLGFEWYQISPHYALVAKGGVRSYAAALGRQFENSAALAWMGALGLQYTF